MKREKRLTKKRRKEEAAALRAEIDILASMERRELVAQIRAISEAQVARMSAKIRNFSSYYGTSIIEMEPAWRPL